MPRVIITFLCVTIRQDRAVLADTPFKLKSTLEDRDSSILFSVLTPQYKCSMCRETAWGHFKQKCMGPSGFVVLGSGFGD